MADENETTENEEAEALESVTEEEAAAQPELELEAPADEAADEAAAALESVTEVEAATQPEPALEPAPAEQPKKPRKRLPRRLRHTHSKPVRERPAARKPIVRIPKQESELGQRQERRGVVVSDKGEKTIIVKVDVIRAHPKYKKVVRRSRKFHAHDEQNAAGVGDVVRIVETRPLSKTKNWRLAEILEKAR